FATAISFRVTPRFLRDDNVPQRYAGEPPSSIQFSTRTPGRRRNWRALLVTPIRPFARVCAPISMSSGPTGSPVFDVRADLSEMGANFRREWEGFKSRTELFEPLMDGKPNMSQMRHIKPAFLQNELLLKTQGKSMCFDGSAPAPTGSPPPIPAGSVP